MRMYREKGEEGGVGNGIRMLVDWIFALSFRDRNWLLPIILLGSWIKFIEVSIWDEQFLKVYIPLPLPSLAC